MNEEQTKIGVEEARLEGVERVHGYPAVAVVPSLPAIARPEPSWLRLAYCFEFLLALLLVVVGWNQIGGQGHIDLMSWYAKLPAVLIVAWCAVRLTAAIVEQPRGWNRLSRLWLMGLLLAGLGMAGLTYYVHLHEVPDEPDTDENSTTSVRNRSPRPSPLLS